jgi:hypothetical protein
VWPWLFIPCQPWGLAGCSQPQRLLWGVGGL